MTGGMEVDFATLMSVSSTWDEAADRLDGSWRRLHGTSASPMDPGVVAAFEIFRENWVDEIKSVATASQTHADNLADAAASYSTVDEAAYERLRAVLPFEYRNSSLDPDGGPAIPTPTPGPSPEPPSDAPTEPSEPSPGPSPEPTP